MNDKDKHKIKLVLRVFENQEISEAEALHHILDFFSVSKRFNYHNFIAGLISGVIIALIILHFNL